LSKRRSDRPLRKSRDLRYRIRAPQHDRSDNLFGNRSLNDANSGISRITKVSRSVGYHRNFTTDFHRHQDRLLAKAQFINVKRDLLGWWDSLPFEQQDRRYMKNLRHRIAKVSNELRNMNGE
jgi:hypothetical protein